MTQIIFMKIYRHEKKRLVSHSVAYVILYTEINQNIFDSTSTKFCQFLYAVSLRAPRWVQCFFCRLYYLLQLSGNGRPTGREPIREENILHNPRINANSSSK
jgi:hypothetical protein